MRNASRRTFIKNTGLVTAGMLGGLMACSTDNKFEKVLVSPSERINLGIIGTGDRTNSQVLKALQYANEIDVIACCDVLEERLNQGLALAGPNSKGYKDYHKLLENKDLDAVAVITPLHLHHKMAMDALDAGFHVTCEKTMVYNTSQAFDLEAKVRQSNKAFRVSLEFRHHPMYLKVKELISSGACGQITHVSCAWNRNGDWRRPVGNPKLERHINWRLYNEYSKGLISEIICHQIDLVNWMLDARPSQVQGTGNINYWNDGREVFDNVHLLFDYPKNITASFKSITSNAKDGYHITLFGDKASIKIGFGEAHIYPERKLSKAEREKVDAISGASIHWFDSPESQLIKYNDAQWEKYSEVLGGYNLCTLIGYKHFAKQIKENIAPDISIKAGKETSIAVDKADIATKNKSIELIDYQLTT